MLIVGAKGFAKEVLEILHQCSDCADLAFYDDVNPALEGRLFESFPIIKNEYEAKKYFKTIDSRFTLGIGDPFLRFLLSNRLKKLGGRLVSVISPKATVGSFGNSIGIGVNFMTGSIITNDVTVGEGTLLNLNATVGHDSTIGKYVEISPGVSISGNCFIGDFSSIGSGAVILPKVRIGKNVVIGAGAVVTRDIEDNSLAVGIPAKIVKHLEPLNII